MGAVDSALMDIDETRSGHIGDGGAVDFVEEASVSNDDFGNEIAARIIATRGRVIGFRNADIPPSEALAAILRHPV